MYFANKIIWLNYLIWYFERALVPIREGVKNTYFLQTCPEKGGGQPQSVNFLLKSRFFFMKDAKCSET